MALKAKTVTREMVKILALGMEEGGEAAAKALPPVYAGDAPDYSLVDCWVQVPEITKDVDTFYIFSTSYVEGSTADEARLFMGEGVDLTLEEQKVFAQRAVGDAVPYLKEEDKKHYEEFRRVCRFQEPGLVETEFIDEIMFRVPMLQQLDAQSAFNKTFCYYWSYPSSNADIGAAHSVELIFVFDLRSVGTTSVFNGENISDEIFEATQQMWTNFARCGDPSTDSIEWKAYSADEQNVMVIAGPGDLHVEQGLLVDQYKAVLPLVGYYQFMDKFFTPGYLTDILAARGQGSELRW